MHIMLLLWLKWASYFLFILTIGNVRARHQPISFGGKIVYCRTSSEVEKAAMDILSKIESIKAPGPVSLGFDLEWRPFPRRGGLFFYLSEFRVQSSICFGETTFWLSFFFLWMFRYVILASSVIWWNIMVTVVFAGEPPCKVAVMQLCMEKTLCYVLHIAHSGVPPKLKSLLEDNSSIKVGNFAWVLCCYPQMFFTFPLYYALLRSVNSLICVLSGWNMHRQRCKKNVEQLWYLRTTIDGFVNLGKCQVSWAS